MFPNKSLVDKIIQNALNEDIATGDVTTNSIIPEDATTMGIIHAKEAGVLAGLPMARRAFELLNPDLVFEEVKKDGDRVSPGDILAKVTGSARDILTGERVALNTLQRLSGIASQTARLVEEISAYNTRIVDTRKTTPGLRAFEKYAVIIGGGSNHRFGLYDGVLIKDNHINVAGSIKKAVQLARENVPHSLRIEVEVESLQGVQEALDSKADIIMLDNMMPSTIREAIDLIDRKALVEVSGGINEQNILDYAASGVDIISIGALTHSVKALDISLDVKEIKIKQNETLLF